MPTPEHRPPNRSDQTGPRRQRPGRRKGGDAGAGEMLTPREVAKRLRCSEWWVKEQARKRRIPFSWIGGSYRFTEEHVHEVIQLFEHRPAGAAFSGTDAVASLSPARVRKPPPAARLKARSPRRAIRAAPPSTEA